MAVKKQTPVPIRVLKLFRKLADSEGRLQVSNRAIQSALGDQSRGAYPPAIQELEQQGLLQRGETDQILGTAYCLDLARVDAFLSAQRKTQITQQKVATQRKKARHLADDMKQLKDLYRAGQITEAEFRRYKQELEPDSE